METEEAARQKSEVLSAGFNEQERTWEVIVKYHGTISGLLEMNQVEALDVLMNGYAIMTVTEAQLEQLVQLEQIEFIEMPKSLQYNTYRAKQVSCILPLMVSGPRLNGSGVLVGIIDSGIDYMLRDFQNDNGSRILYLWDQTLTIGKENGLNEQYKRPVGFSKGIEFTKEEIDRAIEVGNGNNNLENRAVSENLEDRYRRARGVVPSQDVTGHGTAVAGIAAGSSISPLYRGVAPGSELVVVKLQGNRSEAVLTENSIQSESMVNQLSGSEQQEISQNFPLTTDLIRGIHYVLQKAEQLQRPVVINLSIGDTYGAHDGTSLLERFIDSVCENGRNAICIGSGNEAAANGHTSFVLEGEETVEVSIAERERGINIQLWKNYVDEYRLELIAPGGAGYTVAVDRVGKQIWTVGGTQVLIYVGTPKPFSVNQEIFFDFIPTGQYIDSGIWTFVLNPIGSNQHDYHMFLPGSNSRNAATRFVTPTPELTMTVPAFASRALTVGAYDIVTNSYADFSGRDREIAAEESLFFASDIKPDIAAPGVDITAPAAGGGYASFTGTSFAAPIVTGSVALLMEWGIIRGNDRYLYGEKVKAYLRKGAKTLSGDVQIPNAKTGWGALCVSESLPE